LGIAEEQVWSVGIKLQAGYLLEDKRSTLQLS